MAKSPTSRVAKSKGSKFQFKWWMGLILVAIVAGVGIYVLRFSHASSTVGCDAVPAGYTKLKCFAAGDAYEPTTPEIDVIPVHPTDYAAGGGGGIVPCPGTGFAYPQCQWSYTPYTRTWSGPNQNDPFTRSDLAGKELRVCWNMAGFATTEVILVIKQGDDTFAQEKVTVPDNNTVFRQYCISKTGLTSVSNLRFEVYLNSTNSIYIDYMMVMSKPVSTTVVDPNPTPIPTPSPTTPTQTKQYLFDLAQTKIDGGSVASLEKDSSVSGGYKAVQKDGFCLQDSLPFKFTKVKGCKITNLSTQPVGISIKSSKLQEKSSTGKKRICLLVNDKSKIEKLVARVGTQSFDMKFLNKDTNLACTPDNAAIDSIPDPLNILLTNWVGGSTVNSVITRVSTTPY